MLDLAVYAASDIYRALRAGQEAEVGRRSWLARLRDLQRIDRTAPRSATASPRPPRGPRTLTGAHTPWI
ncbi:MAG TPA: hypothetical protein VEZ14_05995 [Dehalococcoidia bacterium]|nr:hypothetical protein [Dehalococcoidia bacterium]